MPGIFTSTAVEPLSPIAELRATGAWFADDLFYLRLSDGREIGAPIAWFPRLASATPEQRANWRLIGRGVGIHWPDIDEDISVLGLLGLPD
jgi:hypothetical protein